MARPLQRLAGFTVSRYETLRHPATAVPVGWQNPEFWR